MGVWLKSLSCRKNTLACFRLNLNNIYSHLKIELTASGSFRLMVNGELIGYGPRRTLMGKSVINEYDLTKYVKDGNINLFVQVVYHGTDSFYIVDEQPFLHARIYLNGILIKTENDFVGYLDLSKREKVRRYSYQRHFIESYDLNHNPLDNCFETNTSLKEYELEEVKTNELVKIDLPYPSFKEISFKEIEKGGVFERNDYSLIECGKSSAYTNKSVVYSENELENDDLALLSKYYYDVTKESTNYFKTYELLSNKTGFIKTSLVANSDSEVFFVFDETINYEKVLHHSVKKENANRIISDLYRNGTLPLHFSRMSTLNIVRYTLKKGEYNLLSFEPYTMKYLRIIMIGSVDVKDASFVLYENDEVYKDFNGKDSKKRIVYDAALSTLAQNSVDILIDCPSRERGGWLCDSYFSARAEHYLTGSNKIEKNFLNCFLEMNYRADLPYGMLPMVYPSNQYNSKFIPNWAMFLFLEIEDYSVRNNDYNFALKFKEKAYNLYNYFQQFENEYSLLENLESWIFVEWSKSNEYTNGINFPTNMLYAEFLRALSRMYKDDLLMFKAKKITKAINELSFNGKFYEDNALRENNKIVLKGNITETCQYYAF